MLSQLGSQQGSLLTAKVLGKGNTAGGITLLQPFSGLTSLATTAGMCEEVMSNCLNIHMTKKAVSQPFSTVLDPHTFPDIILLLKVAYHNNRGYPWSNGQSWSLSILLSL